MNKKRRKVFVLFDGSDEFENNWYIECDYWK